MALSIETQKIRDLVTDGHISELDPIQMQHLCNDHSDLFTVVPTITTPGGRVVTKERVSFFNDLTRAEIIEILQEAGRI